MHALSWLALLVAMAGLVSVLAGEPAAMAGGGPPPTAYVLDNGAGTIVPMSDQHGRCTAPTGPAEFTLRAPLQVVVSKIRCK